MNKYEILKRKFANREVILGTTMSTISSSIILGKMNCDALDFILFDAEHGIFDAQNLVPLLQVCRLMKLPCFVRVQDSKYHLISKVIDMGADGVMLPRVESAEQLRTAIDAMLFYPVGKKGSGGHAQFKMGETFEQFQKSRFLMPQIESPKGIEILPEILEEYGEYISAVMIGPYDLSVMLETPQDIKSLKMIDSIQKIFDISQSYKKSCGIFCDNESYARRYRDMGANVLWTCIDINFYMRGFNETFNELVKIK